MKYQVWVHTRGKSTIEREYPDTPEGEKDAYDFLNALKDEGWYCSIKKVDVE